MDTSRANQRSQSLFQFYSFGPKDILQQPNPEVVLYSAIQSKDFHKAELLVKEGVNVNTRHHNGQTVLHLAAANNDVNFARLLLNAGARPNIPDDFRRTALYFAATKGHYAMVDLLLKHKANTHLVINEPLLHIAIRNGWLHIFNLLLDHLTDPQTEYNGKSVLYVAQFSPNINHNIRQKMVRTLLERGVDACSVPADELVKLEEDIETYMLYAVHGLNCWDAFIRINNTTIRKSVFKGISNLYRSLITTLSSIGLLKQLYDYHGMPHMRDSYKLLRFMSYFSHWVDFDSNADRSLRIIKTMQEAFGLPYSVVEKLCEHLGQRSSSLSQFSRERFQHNWLEETWTPHEAANIGPRP